MLPPSETKSAICQTKKKPAANQPSMASSATVRRAALSVPGAACFTATLGTPIRGSTASACTSPAAAKVGPVRQ